MLIYVSISTDNVGSMNSQEAQKLIKNLLMLAKSGILQRYSSRIEFVNAGSGGNQYSTYKESCSIEIAEPEKIEIGVTPPTVGG